jgi:transcriptional regulator with XRE-family HTH domain
MKPADMTRIRADVLGLTQGQLATLLGIARNTVNEYERGHVNIPGPVRLCLLLLEEKNAK